ncbi:SET domain-containing protein [Hypoxylon sp. FL1857]|nr:SET domain-containing protein [Hypoxylon sp. FL1857]
MSRYSFSSLPEPPAAPDDPQLFEVRQSDGKGLGCFAIRDIEAGEYILREKAGYKVNSVPGEGPTYADLIRNYTLLPQEDKNALQSLYGAEDVEKLGKKAQGLANIGIPIEKQEEYAALQLIFTANNFAIKDAVKRDGTVVQPGEDALFFRASRFNHACDFNVVYNCMSIPNYWISRATRPIKKGEELTLSYIPPYPSRQRRQVGLRSWGFECQCNRCRGWDEEYDTVLREACREQGLFPEGEDKVILPQEPGEEREQAMLRQRVALLERLQWMPALYFAELAYATWHEYRGIELEDTNELDRAKILLRQSVPLYATAINTGTNLWGGEDPFVLEALYNMASVVRRMRRLSNPSETSEEEASDD